MALLSSIGCDSIESPRATFDASRPDVSDAGGLSDLDPSLDFGHPDATDLGGLSDWGEALHTLPVVELPAATESVEAPAACEEHPPFEIALDFPMSRLVVSDWDESIWTWGLDHYITGYVRSGPDEVEEVAFLSELIEPPRLFPLSPDENGARRLFHLDSLYTRDGDATFEYHPIWFTAPGRGGRWVLAVTPSERAILLESETMELWSCPLGCPEPDSVSSVTTHCPLAENCARLTSLPEPENDRAVRTFLDDEKLYWLGERGVWKTELRIDGASELVLETEVRNFATDGSWIAWVNLDGDAYLAHRDGDTRFRLASNLPAPRLESVGPVRTTAEVDVLDIQDDWIWWWDGEEMRGFDLQRNVNLDAAWTTELPSRPLGFELGSCSTYTLLNHEGPTSVLVRPR